MLCSIFLVLLIHLGPSSLNETWQICKIVEPVNLTDVVILALRKYYINTGTTTSVKMAGFTILF